MQLVCVKKFIRLIFTLSVLLIISNCKTDYSPISQCENIPENYRWTVDTLYIPDHTYVHISAIWGSSASNVYAAGESQSAVGTTLTPMFHFNGQAWQRLKIHSNEGGNIQLGSYMDITGFNESSIYVVGGHSIVHFDGVEWSEEFLDESTDLYSIWANRPDDIWTGGYNGTLYHFNGSSWTFYQAPDSVHIRSISGFDTDEVYAIAGKLVNKRWWSFFLKWDGQKWAVLEKFDTVVTESEDSFGQYDLFAVDSVLFSVGQGLWRRTRTDTLWSPDFYSLTDYLCVFGTSSDNLWLGGAGGSFAYYSNFENALWINSFRNLTTHFRDIWTDGNLSLIHI